jgi:hypothetical protein
MAMASEEGFRHSGEGRNPVHFRYALGVRLASRGLFDYWIPAFAGMTMELSFHE